MVTLLLWTFEEVAIDRLVGRDFLTNAYSVPLPAGTQVQAKIYASVVGFWHAGASLGMSHVIGVSNRSSIWKITWTCCAASQAH